MPVEKSRKRVGFVIYSYSLKSSAFLTVKRTAKV